MNRLKYELHINEFVQLNQVELYDSHITKTEVEARDLFFREDFGNFLPFALPEFCLQDNSESYKLIGCNFLTIFA